MNLEELWNQIHKEAQIGFIDCGIKHWLYYSTYRYENGKSYFNDVEKYYDGAIVPCLKVIDSKSFLEVFSSYLALAKSFYGELDYDRVCDVDKYTIATVLSNMTLEDFDRPVDFFNRRIAFLQDSTLDEFKITRDIGYSKMLDANIEVEIRNEPIFMETPYGVYTSIVKYEDGERLSYSLPVVRLGICGSKVYIYAVQNDQVEEAKDTPLKQAFFKQIKRKLYAVGAGLSHEEREIKTIDNIHEVSPSSLVSLIITLGLLKSRGVSLIVAYPLLINRYNATLIYSKEEYKRLITMKDDLYKDILNHLAYLRKNLDVIQANISEKFIRNFRRIAYHFDGIEVSDLLVGDCLPLYMNIGDCIHGNNPLLEELFHLGLCYNHRSNRDIIKSKK